MELTKAYLVVLGAALVTACSACHARDDAVLTSGAVVRLALENNPHVAALRHELDAVRYAVAGAGALTNPELAVTPPLTDGGSDEEFIFRQPLEINGARGLRRAVAETGARSRRAAVAVEILDLVTSVKTAYYELARVRERLALARFLESSASEFDRAMQRQVELGSRPGIERTQTALELSRARQQLASATADVHVAEAALNALIGRAPSAEVGALAKLTPSSERPIAEGILNSAMERRPEMQAQRALAQAAESEAALTRAEGRPDIAAQFRADRLGGGAGEGGIGVAITIPLIDHGSRRARVRQAEAEAKSRASRAEELEIGIRSEVAQALTRVQEAEARAAAYEEGLLAQASRLLEASRVGLTEGKTSILTVLEAQRTYREVETERISALVDLAHARVALERAAGSFPADDTLAWMEDRL